MSGRSNSVHNLVQAAVKAAGFAQRTDAELIVDFLKGDATAFESLLRRHGPMVLQACRQITRCEADAEDAFQATFVLLHQKARTIRNATVGGWLFRVARRAAATARRTSERRERREARTVRPVATESADPSWREVAAILHEELDRLPTKYRLPLILCYLQGLPRDDAAQRLGCSVDSLRGRVDRGRVQLRSRLQKRGITLSAGLLASLLPTTLPSSLIAGVVSPSANVTALVHAASAVSRAWTLGGSLSVATGLLMGLVVLAAGAGAPPTDPAPPKGKASEPPAIVARKDFADDPLPDGAVGRLGTFRFNHGGGLTTLHYLNRGKEILSLGKGLCRIWDAETGKELRSFPIAKGSWDNQIAVSADGTTLTLLQQEFKGDPLRTYDLTSGKELSNRTLQPARMEMSVDRRNAISSDGKLVISNTPKGIYIFDTAPKKDVRPLDRSARDLRGIAFVDTNHYVTSDKDGLVATWEARTGELVRSFKHDGPAEMIVASSDGKLVATLAHPVESDSSLYEKDVARLWDLNAGKKLHALESLPKSRYTGLLFSEDGQMLVTSSTNRAGGVVTLWDTRTGQRMRELPDYGDIRALSADGKKLLVGSQRGVFTLWDTGTGERLSSDEPIHSLAPALYLSAKGDRAITVGHTTVSDWDVKAGRRLQSFEVPRLTSYNRSRTISPDGRRALTVSRSLDQSFLHVWDLEAHRELRKISIEGEFPATTFAFSPDSKTFALLRPGDPRATVTVYEVDSGKEITSFVDPNKRWSSSLFFTNQGKTIVVVSKRIAGFSVADGKMLFNYRVEPAAAPPTKDPGIVLGLEKEETTGWLTGVFSQIGDLAACVLKGPQVGFGSSPVESRLALLDGRTGKVIRRWQDTGKPTHDPVKLAFSPDGRLLATSDAYDIHVWETATGKEVRTFHGHRNEIESLAFSADGRRLASGSGDCTVLVWGLEPAKRSDPAEWWKELLSQDAAVAYAATWQLADAADDVAMPILKKNLHAVIYADQRRILEAIVDLDGDQFRVRESAFKDLVEIGIAARPELERAATRRPSAEKATRLERLLAKVVGPPAEGESLRTWRALGALEAKATLGAKALLRELTAGVPDAWLTREAAAALRRSEGR